MMSYYKGDKQCPPLAVFKTVNVAVNAVFYENEKICLNCFFERSSC